MNQLGLVVGLVMLVSGCGGDGGSHPLADAPPGSGGDVSLTVTQGGKPVAGQAVYFQNSDSTLVRETRTDAAGKASATMARGGFVTVIEPELGVAIVSTRLATFAGVAPGDQLRLDVEPAFDPGAAVTFDLSVPNEQAGNLYTLFSSCGQALIGRGNGSVRAGVGASATSSLAVTASVTLNGCNGIADMLVLGVNSDGALASWLYKPAVAVADGVPVAVTDDFQPPVDTTFSYTGVTPAITSIAVERELHTSHGHLYSTSNDNGLVYAIPDGTTASVSVPLPAAAGLAMVTTGTDQPARGPGQQSIIEWGPATSSYTADYPALTLRGYASAPTIDVASHAITWTDGAGAAPDYVLASYIGFRDGTDQLQWDWRIVAPYVAGQPRVVFPVLPTTMQDYNPRTTDDAEVIRLAAVKSPGGYDAARPHVFSDDLPTGIVGAAGTIVVEELLPPPEQGRRRPAPVVHTQRGARLRTR